MAVTVPSALASVACATARCTRVHIIAAPCAGFRQGPALGSVSRGSAARPAARPLTTVPRTAAAAAAPAVYEATGVPLVDALMKLPSVEAAAQHGVQLVVMAFVGVAVANLVMMGIDRVAGGRLREGGAALNLPAAVLSSVLEPAQALLPFWGLAYATTVAASLFQVAATKMSPNFAAICRGHEAEVLSVITTFTQLVQDTSELVVIIGAAWAAIGLKNKVIAWLGTRLGGDKGSNDFVVALLTPFSSVLSFLVFLAAGTTALSAYGVNVGPLMASVGGIGVAVGLATQSLAANVVSALALYSGRPFVVGDRVELLAAGALVVAGTVESIDPTRTVIRDDSGAPIYLSNSEVTACAVKNLTQAEAFRAAKA